MMEVHRIERYPFWIDALVELVRQAVTPMSFIGRLGFWAWAPDNLGNLIEGGWTIFVFPVPNEIVGGRNDGLVTVDGFTLAVDKLLHEFHEVEQATWHALAADAPDFEGPNFTIVGVFLGNPVHLKVFNVPPHAERPEFCLPANDALGPKTAAGS